MYENRRNTTQNNPETKSDNTEFDLKTKCSSIGKTINYPSRSLYRFETVHNSRTKTLSRVFASMKAKFYKSFNIEAKSYKKNISNKKI